MARTSSTGSDYDGDYSLRIYSRQALGEELLTPAQELSLSKRIKRGDEEAREIMIKANLRLVVKIAKDYDGFGLPLIDLIGEGNIGLMKAIERFDPIKGAKLSTYAAWWIKQSIKRALANQGKTIRMPVHLVTLLGKLRRTEKKLHMKLGREPEMSEIAFEAGVKEEKAMLVFDAAQRCSSLDALIGDSYTDSFLDVTADPSARMPYENIEASTMHELVMERFDVLDERERDILIMRFGLDGADKKTLDEIGRRFGVTRERIRQVQNMALYKLRAALERSDVRDPVMDEFVEKRKM